jgi:tetratricopeptide (TPR) repeat protein
LAIRTGHFARACGQFSEALGLAQQAEDDYLIMQAHCGLGWTVLDHEQGIEMLREALRLAQAHGLAWDAAQAQGVLSGRLRLIGQREASLRQRRESVSGLSTLGDMYYPVQEHWLLGAQAMDKGEYAEARALCEQLVAYARALRDPVELADGLLGLAQVALRQGDEAGTVAAVREAVLLYYKVGNLDRPGQCASFAAGVARLRGDLRRAATLLGAADALWRPYQDNPFRPNMDAEYVRLRPLVRAELAPADFNAAWAEGQQMTVRQVMADILDM